MSRRRLAVVALGMLLLLPGCGFRTRKRDIMRLEGMALLGGHMSRAPEDGTPIVIGLVDVASSRRSSSRARASAWPAPITLSTPWDGHHGAQLGVE